MSEEYSTTVGFEDLLEEEEGVFTREVTLKTGAGGNTVPERKIERGQNPDAHRWLFNPFEVIDLRNEGASCGMPYLENVVFNRVKSLNISVGKTDSYNLPTDKHSAANYDKFARTAEMIARELCDKNGDKGVVDLAALIGFEDDRPAKYNTLLFGEEVECVFDINSPEHPVPVLPNLLEALDYNSRQAIAAATLAERNILIDLTRQIRLSISRAATNARARITEAQKRMLDEKNPNRMPSASEQRCYLALGEPIPDQMPLVGKGQFNNTGIDNQQIAAAVTAGVSAAMGVRGTTSTASSSAPVIPVRKTTGAKTSIQPEDLGTVGDDVPDFTVDPADLEEKSFAMHQQVKVGDKVGEVIGKEGGNLRVDFGNGEIGKFKKDQFDEIEAV